MAWCDHCSYLQTETFLIQLLSNPHTHELTNALPKHLVAPYSAEHDGMQERFGCLRTATQYPPDLISSYWVSAECKRISSCYLDSITCVHDPQCTGTTQILQVFFLQIHLHLFKAGGFVLQGSHFLLFRLGNQIETHIESLCNVMSLRRPDHVQRDMGSTQTSFIVSTLSVFRVGSSSKGQYSSERTGLEAPGFEDLYFRAG